MEKFFSIKNMALMSFLSCVILLMNQTYSDLGAMAIVIISIIVLFRLKGNKTMQAVASSILFSELLYIIARALDTSIIPITYQILALMLIISPLIYAMFSTKGNGDFILKKDLIIITSIVFLMRLPYTRYIIPGPIVYNLSYYSFLISLIMLFVCSIKETSNKTIRVSGYIAIVSTFVILICAILYINNPLYGETFYIKHFATELQFTIGIISPIISGLAIAFYFFTILKQTNYTIKKECIPAIIFFILWGITNSVAANSWYMFYDIELLHDIIYITIAYSLYKFYKLF